MKFISKVSKTKVIVFVVVFVLGAALGRYATPEKVTVEIEKVEVERIVEIEKKVFVKDETKKTSVKRNTQTEKVTKPDGTIIEKTSESEEDITFATNKEGESTEKGTEKTSSTSESKKTETKYDTKKLSASLMAGVKTDTPDNASFDNYLMYGVHVSYRFAGPFSVGVFGTTTSEFGVSVGLDF